MASNGGLSEAHFLVLPFVEQGHINPMLSIASHLVALGCRVTFVKAGRKQQGAAAESNEEGGEEAAPERLRFVTLEDEDESADDQSERLGQEAMTKIFARHEKRTGRLVTRLLRESATSTHPISGVICDFFMWKWVSQHIRAHGLPLAVLNVCAATFFYMLYLRHKRKYSEIEDLLVHSDLGLPTIDYFNGLDSSKDTQEENEQIAKFFSDFFEGFDETRPIVLCNSFHAMEAPLLPFLDASPLEFAFIGPCFPVWNTDRAGMGKAMAQSAGCPFVEDDSCLLWLDKQEKGSVLYVSFGSVAVLRDEAQMEEIAAGIEKSGYKFLWVVRPDATEGMQPPKVFREQIERGKGEKGMFVAWVPQKTVLKHPAVGGFLTHCGWNSLVESFTSGVPALALPFFGDQPLNANLVHWYWKIGVRLECCGNSALVGREEVEKGVCTIMQDPEVSRRVAEYQQAAQAAIADGPQRFASFVRSMTRKATQ